ncbi:uncharacterized protein ACJ7VT_004172 [Polymixia lowei]
MAEVRLRVGKGAYSFANKTCNQHLNIPSKQGNGATHAAFLSAQWSVDIRSGQVNVADILSRAPSEEVTAAAPPVCYATVNSLSRGDHREIYELYHDATESKDGSVFEFTRDDRLPDLTRGRPTDPTDVSALARNGLVTAGQQHARCRVFLARRRQQQQQQSLVNHLLGREQLVCFRRFYSGNGDRFEPLYKTKTGYYDVLEVSPTATHAQIKTAYYKQSFIYHPDKNAGSEAATTRFSEISEAYNVLGNKALRKKYDRGILNLADLTGSTRPSAKDAASAKQQTRAGHSVMGVDSQKVFDFDGFIKSHYGEQLQREKDMRVRKEEMLRKKEATASDWQLGKMMEMAVGVLFAMALAIVFNLKRGESVPLQ